MQTLKELTCRASSDEAVTAVLLNRLLNSKVPSMQQLGREILERFEGEVSKLIEGNVQPGEYPTEPGMMVIGAIIALNELEGAQAETGKPRIRKAV